RNILEYCMHIVGCGAAVTEYRRARWRSLPTRSAPREILSHHGERWRKVGKKFLSCVLHRIVHLEAEPTAKRLRNDIGKAVARHYGRDRLAESCGYIPSEGDRSECGASNTCDGQGANFSALATFRKLKKLLHVEKRLMHIGR